MFFTFVKWYYLNYSGYRGQKIIPWRSAQDQHSSCIYAWYKDAVNTLRKKFVFCIRTQCVPRVKHSPPQLHETSVLMFCKV
jgi:hypothetical protein